MKFLRRSRRKSSRQFDANKRPTFGAISGAIVEGREYDGACHRGCNTDDASIIDHATAPVQCLTADDYR